MAFAGEPAGYSFGYFQQLAPDRLAVAQAFGSARWVAGLARQKRCANPHPIRTLRRRIAPAFTHHYIVTARVDLANLKF